MDTWLENNTKVNTPVEVCPVLGIECQFYQYQCDNFGEVAICYCNHVDNQSDFEGNCQRILCPILK